MIRNEQLKIQIDKITQDMNNDLDNYESECKNFYGNNAETTDFKNLLDNLREKNELAKNKWNEWWGVLNELKFDLDKWCQIDRDSSRTFTNHAY